MAFVTLKEWRARSKRDAGIRAALKERFAARLALEADDAVTVSEIACLEPNCPDTETVILLMRAGSPTRAYKIACPMADVTDEAFETACDALLRERETAV